MAPEITYRIGSVSASVFRNEQGERPFRSVSIQRRYKDAETGKWQSSTSFTLSHLPALKEVVAMALDYVIDKDATAAGEAAD